VEKLPDELLAAAERRGLTVADPSAPRVARETVDGIELSYVDWGGPTDRTVVFVHGGALTNRTWDFVCLALRPAFRCVAVDLRGHGDSAWAPSPEQYELTGFANDVRGILAAVGTRDVVLVGMSLGGQASLLVASAEPQVRGLVLVDVGPEPNRAAATAIIAGIRKPAEFEHLDSVVEHALRLNQRRDPGELRSSLLHNVRRLPNGRLTWKYDHRAFAAMTPETLDRRAEMMWAAVDRINCPVLVVRGAESTVFDDERATVLQARLRDARVRVVAQAGHTVQGDNPAGLVEAIEPFLRDCFAYAGGSRRPPAPTS
jgi:esterase